VTFTRTLTSFVKIAYSKELNVAENAYIYTKVCKKEPWEIIVTPPAKELSGEYEFTNKPLEGGPASIALF
jgi:hypothetical protein